MIRLYSISVFLFLITACASNDKVADSNYNNVWIKKVSGKSVMAPNGYLYTFKENGNVEYKINGMVTGRGVFLYAETATNAYYYEKMPLSYVAYGVRDSIPNTNVNMFVGFVLDDNGKIKMTSGYTKEYQNRLSNWKKSNLTIYNTLREGKDMSEYPIPYVEEVNTLNLIEFGVLR